MLEIKTENYHFNIYSRDGQTKRLYCRADFVTGGGPWPMEKPDKEIIEEFIEAHFQPRPFRNLEGIEEYFDPICTSREMDTKFFALKDRLEEVLTGQKDLFEGVAG